MADDWIIPIILLGSLAIGGYFLFNWWVKSAVDRIQTPATKQYANNLLAQQKAGKLTKQAGTNKFLQYVATGKSNMGYYY